PASVNRELLEAAVVVEDLDPVRDAPDGASGIDLPDPPPPETASVKLAHSHVAREPGDVIGGRILLLRFLAAHAVFDAVVADERDPELRVSRLPHVDDLDRIVSGQRRVEPRVEP